MIAETPDAPAPGTVLEALPIFPLPGTIFFPNTLLPLHVFEPRYRRMVEALPEENAYLAVALLMGDWRDNYHGAPRVAPVMGMGEVVHREQSDDGRWHILLRGLARVKMMEELATEEPFRMVRAVVLGARSTPEDEVELQQNLPTLRHFFATILSRVPGVDISEASRLFDPETPSGLVVDSITSALPVVPEQKQALLEELRPGARAARLSAILAEMLVRDFPDTAGHAPVSGGDA